ncbi:MAG TPA: tryptophan synthase subunit alpha [Treponemataceae bacterium]|nr:tryptophan synthase subunit alpha [Treponemataceae bacterium]HQC26470.1 tryptophan synthase subunit alpha [Treponemataceae bacterium]
MKQKIKLMAHQIALYPNKEAALLYAQALVEGGAEILEIQIPFSDPSADGPLIQEACAQTIAAGVRVKDCFAFIKSIHEAFPKLCIYLMSYASILVSYGLESFVLESKAVGVSGFIVPDLPFDSNEGLIDFAEAQGLLYIPVITTSMSEERLERILACGFTLVYCAIRKGITGSKTEIADETIVFLDGLKNRGIKVLAGFGIVEKSQAELLGPHVEAIVAGSVFVEIMQKQTKENLAQDKIVLLLEEKSKELSGK